MRNVRAGLPAAGLFLMVAGLSSAGDVAELIETVRSVGPRGEGHPAATAAVRELQQADGEALLPILAAMHDAGPVASNWLQGAYETIAARELASPDGLPRDALEAFVRDREQAPQARRLAYNWLLKADPSAADRILPDMLDDPAAELRRDAVARLILAAEARGDAGDAQAARSIWQQALGGAVDGDQVEQIAKALDELDAPVDLVAHFALLTEWRVIGPFDNHDQRGFAAAYPPENEMNFEAEYAGQLGSVRWEPIAADGAESVRDVNQLGVLDLAKLTAPYKGAASYLATEFAGDAERAVEFRLGTQNAWKVWLNGEFLFGHEEYHRGAQFDQYVVPATLRKGKNVILLKICQNEQNEDWAQSWSVQFRVCDASGRGIVSRKLAASR